MKQTQIFGNIAFLSTYPPCECGIATFAEDLITALDHSNMIKTHVIAISDSDDLIYGNKVMGEIRRNEQNDYVAMAGKLNASNIDLLVIEHEYGIYGGDHGDFLLDLVNHLEIPIVTTLHTILSEPSSKQRIIINELGKKSIKIITMARNTKRMLQTIYGVDAEKIEVIHHGVPQISVPSRVRLKKNLGYENKKIISTFGLIGPGKGIEHGIEAIAHVLNRSAEGDTYHYHNKDVLYLILGQTHPALKEKGKAYRKKLEALVDQLGLNENVAFVNRYLSKKEIITYLQLSDIYMTPYLAKDQAVSGTLAYAVGYGKAIVSTPYLYAKEMLSDGNGLLAEFSKPESLAECINQILEDPFKQRMLERNTSKIGSKMYWDEVANQYMSVFLSIVSLKSQIGAV